MNAIGKEKNYKKKNVFEKKINKKINNKVKRLRKNKS